MASAEWKKPEPVETEDVVLRLTKTEAEALKHRLGGVGSSGPLGRTWTALNATGITGKKHSGDWLD